MGCHELREQRRAACRRVFFGEPQRARFAHGIGVGARAQLQRVAGDFNVVLAQLRTLGLEQLPLLGFAQPLQPIRAQALGDEAVLVLGEKRPHRLRIGVVQPRTQLPVGRVRLQHMTLQTRREGIEFARVVDAKRFAHGHEIIVAGRGCHTNGQPQGRQR